MIVSLGGWRQGGHVIDTPVAVWQEALDHYPTLSLRFACTCSRERIGRMLVSLGRDEVDSIIAEQGTVTVTCDFCNQQYTFDPDDAARLFAGGDGVAADTVTRH